MEIESEKGQSETSATSEDKKAFPENQESYFEMSQCFVNVLQKDKKFNELKKLIEDKNAASNKKVDL